MPAHSNGDPDLASLLAAYTRWRNSTLGRITDALELDLILGMAGPVTTRRILDVGCGDGLLALCLAGQGAHVTGIDVSPPMIAAAQRRFARHGNDAYLAVAEVEALPFAADTFDAVIVNAVLCFIENPESALREMARVLKPGGTLIIGELGRSNAWAVVRRIKGWLGSRVWRRARFRSPSELRRLVAQAGMAEVCVKGAVFYPPLGIAARLLNPIDGSIGRFTTTGAAFLALAATKPPQAGENSEVAIAESER